MGIPGVLWKFNETFIYIVRHFAEILTFYLASSVTIISEQDRKAGHHMSDFFVIKVTPSTRAKSRNSFALQGLKIVPAVFHPHTV